MSRSFCYSNSSVLLFNYGTVLFVISFYKEPFTQNTCTTYVKVKTSVVPERAGLDMTSSVN